MVVNDNAGEPDAPRCSLVHREQARSYKLPPMPVGASPLAMVVNDNAGNLMPRGVL